MNFQPQLASDAHRASHLSLQSVSSVRKLLSHALVFALAAVVLWPSVFILYTKSALAGDGSTEVIQVTAKKYEYSPAPIHVKRGAKIELKITAIDHDHGFSIFPVPDGGNLNGPVGLVFTSAQECWQLKKGETTTIEFLAQTPGTYSFKCCHVCGLGHRGMKGQLVVD
ncbi:MAG: cupredoxin domain-containing protein [Candidatus Acidiferrales bacterium]